MRYSIISGGLLSRAVAGLTLVWMMACARGNAAEQDTLALDAMSVGPENIVVATQTMLATGPIISGSLAPTREAAIRAELSGPVLSVHAEEGQP